LRPPLVEDLGYLVRHRQTIAGSSLLNYSLTS
jgi:hypothetical protein